MNRDEVIALARKLYDGGKGLSYGKIADKFNADGILTLSGKGSWEKKMVSRLIAADTLKKAEVKTGLKSDREVQLESEIESLKAEQNQMLDVISMLRKQNVEMKEMISAEASMKDDVISVISQLESENAGLRSDRDEALKELNTVKQHLSERTMQINAVYAVNAKLTRKSDRLMSGVRRLKSDMKEVKRYRDQLQAAYDEMKDAYSNDETIARQKAEIVRLMLESDINNLKSSNDSLETKNDELAYEIDQLKVQRDCFKAESERLNRQLTYAESKYKGLYESEITRLGSELAIAKQKIQELQDRQVFIKPESESGIPKNFMGWTLGKRSDGRGYNIYRKIAGKLHGLYIGKEWNADDARRKIASFESKQKPQSDLFPVSECKSCQHQPEFESRLRQVCPETVRTYRLDTVAGNFPDCNFGSEMIALAEQKRIELLAGDAIQCDVSKLVQYRGRMYVNFEWR